MSVKRYCNINQYEQISFFCPQYLEILLDMWK